MDAVISQSLLAESSRVPSLLAECASHGWAESTGPVLATVGCKIDTIGQEIFSFNFFFQHILQLQLIFSTQIYLFTSYFLEA
jgi:hypothetical protein